MHGPTCIFWANLTPCSLKEGTLGWDERVQTYMPSFRFKDE